MVKTYKFKASSKSKRKGDSTKGPVPMYTHGWHPKYPFKGADEQHKESATMARDVLQALMQRSSGKIKVHCLSISP
jgi:hypothetical protein